MLYEGLARNKETNEIVKFELSGTKETDKKASNTYYFKFKVNDQIITENDKSYTFKICMHWPLNENKPSKILDYLDKNELNIISANLILNSTDIDFIGNELKKEIIWNDKINGKDYMEYKILNDLTNNQECLNSDFIDFIMECLNIGQPDYTDISMNWWTDDLLELFSGVNINLNNNFINSFIDERIENINELIENDNIYELMENEILF